MKIGFIGQGYVGKNYADDFENRGFSIVRYSLEEQYKNNKAAVGACDIIFVAVPTPTTPSGFDLSIVEEALSYIQDGKIAVIKSTIVPGSTVALQKKYPKLVVLFSPEFLREATAAHDAAHPYSVIVGTPVSDEIHGRAAAQVLEILPDAPFKQVYGSTEAEFVKYVQNVSGYFQIVLFNLMYDLAQKVGANWDMVRDAIKADPDIASRFSNPVHKGGRGAGGSCLIKDLAAIRELYAKILPEDVQGNELLAAMEHKNLQLLVSTNKTMDHVKLVYGDKKQYY